MRSCRVLWFPELPERRPVSHDTARDRGSLRARRSRDPLVAGHIRLPQPTGKRGRWHEYDPDAVNAAVRAILALPAEDDADPAELLDTRQAAAEAGVAWATLRSYISRGVKYWPAPDSEDNGVKRWRQNTVGAAMAAKRPNKRRRPRG